MSQQVITMLNCMYVQILALVICSSLHTDCLANFLNFYPPLHYVCNFHVDNFYHMLHKDKKLLRMLYFLRINVQELRKSHSIYILCLLLALAIDVCTYMAACVHSYYCSTLLRQHHECSKLIGALLACLLFTLMLRILSL